MRNLDASLPESARLRVVKPTATAPRAFRAPRPTGGLQEQLLQLRRGIAAFRERNAELESSIGRLTNFADCESGRPAMIAAFSRDLDCLRKRLELRQARLIELERQVTLFRPEEAPVAAPPTRHELRMPPPRRFVLSLEDAPRQKAHIRREHAQLASEVLANERLIVLTRMRLRLAHDHRDLAALRRRLERLFAGGEDEDGAEARARTLREQCRTVAAAIRAEKDRIKQENWVCADEYFAAVAIQSAWRGHACRAVKAAA
jgi:hypothetical protein